MHVRVLRAKLCSTGKGFERLTAHGGRVRDGHEPRVGSAIGSTRTLAASGAVVGPDMGATAAEVYEMSVSGGVRPSHGLSARIGAVAASERVREAMVEQ